MSIDCIKVELWVYSRKRNGFLLSCFAGLLYYFYFQDYCVYYLVEKFNIFFTLTVSKCLFSLKYFKIIFVS